MFRVIYIDKNGYGHKGGFKTDKDANDWGATQQDTAIVPIRLMVWSEEIKSFRNLYDY